MSNNTLLALGTAWNLVQSCPFFGSEKKAAGLQGWFKKTSQEMRPPDMYIQIYVIICIYIFIHIYICICIYKYRSCTGDIHVAAYETKKDSPYHSTDNMQHPVTKLIQNCSKHQRTTKDFWYILKPSFLSNVQFRPLAGCKDLPSPHWHFLRTVSSVQKTAGSVDGRVCTCGIEAWAVEQGSKSLD